MVGLAKYATALSLAVGLTALASQGFSQQTGGAPAPGAVTPPTTPTPNPTPAPGPGRGNPGISQPQQPPTEIQRPIFLSGKVTLDDGTPPPQNVIIERVCNGNPRQEAHTDSKGRFSFQLGGNSMMIQDASMSSSNDSFGQLGGGRSGLGGNGMPGMNAGVSERDLMGCEIRAALPGYRSDTVPLGGRRQFDNPELGTIILHKLGHIEGVTISAISLQAPKDAKKAWEKGRDFLKKKKVPEAQKEFEKAVQIYPRYSHAWFDLGFSLEAQNNIEGAYKAYAEAVTIDPKYVPPYQRLTGLYIKEKKWQDAADSSGKLLKLNPFEYADAHYNNAVANYFLKNYDDAEKSVREARKLDPRNKMVRSGYLLGTILIEKQDYVGAAEQLRQYLSILPAGQTDENATKQLTALEAFMSNRNPK